MGCNCKKKYDSLSKYADNKTEEKNDSIPYRIANLIAQILFGTLTAILFAIIVIPILIYIIICIILGKEPSIRIKNPKKYFKRNES